MKIAKTIIFLLLIIGCVTNCQRGPEGESMSPVGNLEQVSSTEIVGWAMNQSNPGSPVHVEILVGDILLTTVKADLFREDLKKTGFGDGKHQFRVAIPDVLRDGKPHLIRARIAGVTNELRGSPKTFQASVVMGFLEHVSAAAIIGWAFDRSRPGEPVEVEILDGEHLLGSVKANLYREDLLKSGIGTGHHQFRFSTPARLNDGQTHTIHARFAQTKTELDHSPKTLTTTAKPAP